MPGVGFTPLEQTIDEQGEPARVVAMREDSSALASGTLARRAAYGT